MNISPVVTAGSAGAPTSAAGPSGPALTNTLNYNDFLQLLMTELRNQDPTQPMDPAQMVTQLATVSEVGQSVQTNATLNSLLNSNALSQAELLVGQNIASVDGSISGTVASVSVSSAGTFATLTDGTTVSLSNGAVIW